MTSGAKTGTAKRREFWITGLIDPAGAGTVDHRHPKKAWLELNVSPWREGRGPLVEGSLRLVMLIEHTDWFRLYPLLGEGAIRRFRIRMRDGSLEAELLEVGPRVRQVAFERAARKQLKPITLRDEVLGSFTLERSVDWYEGTRRFRRRKYKLNVKRSRRDGMAGDSDDLLRARAIVERTEGSFDRIWNRIAKEMLPLYNDTWRNEGRKRLTREPFLARIRLESMVVRPDKSVTLYFTDGGLFSDHVIEVRLNKKGLLSEEPLLAG